MEEKGRIFQKKTVIPVQTGIQIFFPCSQHWTPAGVYPDIVIGRGRSDEKRDGLQSFVQIIFAVRTLVNPQKDTDMLLINKAKNPFIAAGFLLRGITLLTNPKLRLFILIPILINIVLYSVAFALGYYYVDTLIARFIPESLQWLRWILWPLFFISFFIAGFFTFTVLANLIASPFYGILSAKTLAVISGKTQVVEQPVMRVIAAELKRALYIMTRMLPLLVLFFIPVINIIASFALSLFGAWCLAMEFMAYPLENEGLLFVDQKRLLKTVWLGALSFGAVTMIGLTVPVLNIIIGPAAVIGSTIYIHEMREKEGPAVSGDRVM